VIRRSKPNDHLPPFMAEVDTRHSHTSAPLFAFVEGTDQLTLHYAVLSVKRFGESNVAHLRTSNFMTFDELNFAYIYSHECLCFFLISLSVRAC
jgi:hypothetical protein